MFGSALLVFRQQVSRLEMFGFLFLLPLLVDFGARAGAFWYPLTMGFFPDWYWVVCASAGIALTCLFWSIQKRTLINAAA